MATAVGFQGTIRGYNLSDSGVPPACYAEFRKNGKGCDLWIRHWDRTEGTKGHNTERVHHKIVKRRQNATHDGYVTNVETQTAQVVTAASTVGLQIAATEKLRR